MLDNIYVMSGLVYIMGRTCANLSKEPYIESKVKSLVFSTTLVLTIVLSLRLVYIALRTLSEV